MLPTYDFRSLVPGSPIPDPWPPARPLIPVSAKLKREHQVADNFEGRLTARGT
jgi:hypothetical protein